MSFLRGIVLVGSLLALATALGYLPQNTGSQARPAPPVTAPQIDLERTV